MHYFHVLIYIDVNCTIFIFNLPIHIFIFVYYVLSPPNKFAHRRPIYNLNTKNGVRTYMSLTLCDVNITDFSWRCLLHIHDCDVTSHSTYWITSSTTDMYDEQLPTIAVHGVISGHVGRWGVGLADWVSYAVVFWSHKETCNEQSTNRFMWDVYTSFNDGLSQLPLGPYSLSSKTSYRKISWSLEVARFGFRLFQSIWNLTGPSAAALPRCLSNFRVVRYL